MLWMPGWVPLRLRVLLGANLDEVTSVSLHRLIGLSEDHDLDFKREPYGKGPKHSKEAALDIAGFANAMGGLIVFGMDEDGVGRASKLVPYTADDDFFLWVQQIVASRISPVPGVACWPVEVDDGLIYIVSISPSTRKPHGVAVSNDTLRFPVRSGTTRRYMAEPELADLYYSRLFGAVELGKRIQDLHDSARSLVPPGKDSMGKAWMVLSCVPSAPGDLQLEEGLDKKWSGWVTPALGEFPRQYEQRYITRSFIGFRSIQLRNGSPEGDYNLALDLRLDGSGLMLVDQLKPVWDEEVVGDVINGLGVLARHASKAGAAGDLCIGSQILTNSGLSLGHFSRGKPRPMRDSRSVGGDTPIGKRTTPIDGAAVPGPALVALTRNVTGDLFSPFGIPQTHHITADNRLVLSRFYERKEQVQKWAHEAGVTFGERSAGEG